MLGACGKRIVIRGYGVGVRVRGLCLLLLPRVLPVGLGGDVCTIGGRKHRDIGRTISRDTSCRCDRRRDRVPIPNCRTGMRLQWTEGSETHLSDECQVIDGLVQMGLVIKQGDASNIERHHGKVAPGGEDDFQAMSHTRLHIGKIDDAEWQLHADKEWKGAAKDDFFPESEVVAFVQEETFSA